MAIQESRNLRWSLDVVPATLFNGRRFRILTVVADFTQNASSWSWTLRSLGQRVALSLIVSPNYEVMRVHWNLPVSAEGEEDQCLVREDHEVSHVALSRHPIAGPLQGR
jgi:hypothetical protein